MRLTESQLRKIINEEVRRHLGLSEAQWHENWMDEPETEPVDEDALPERAATVVTKRDPSGRTVTTAVIWSPQAEYLRLNAREVILAWADDYGDGEWIDRGEDEPGVWSASSWAAGGVSEDETLEAVEVAVDVNKAALGRGKPVRPFSSTGELLRNGEAHLHGSTPEALVRRAKALWPKSEGEEL